MGPVPGGERITVIDCLRGAALFGMMTANMRGFDAPVPAYIQPSLMWTWLPDRLAQALVDWLIHGKFITIFAALFGVRVRDPDGSRRRAPSGRGILHPPDGGLLLIGMVHAFGLWWGDILISYAVCGYFLPLFRNLGQGAVLR